MSAKQLADLLLSSESDPGFNPLASMTPPQPASPNNSNMLALMIRQQLQENKDTQNRFSNEGRRGAGGLLAGVLNNLAARQARSRGNESIQELYRQYVDAQTREQAAAQRKAAEAANQKRLQEREDYLFQESIKSGFRQQEEAAKRAADEATKAGTSASVAEVLEGGITPEAIVEVAGMDPQLASTLATVQSTTTRTQLAADKAQREKEEAETIKKKAKEESQRALGSVRSLLGNRSGLAGATGPVQSIFPSFRESVVDFEAELQNLASLLTVGNLDRMTGVLSESDISLLRDAASGNLDLRQSEGRLYETLAKIEGALSSGLGEAPLFEGTTWDDDTDSDVDALLMKYGQRRAAN